MSNFTPEQEFAFVAAQLTDDELQTIDDMLSEGRLSGSWYVMDDCGCFYGWIGIQHGVLNQRSYVFEGKQFRDSLLGDRLADFYNPESTTTVLELAVAKINRGDTPDDSDQAEWLHELIFGELCRRDERFLTLTD